MPFDPRPIPLIIFLIFAALWPGAAAAEPVSVYTKLDLDTGCVTLETTPLGGTLQCPGHAGYPVVFSEEDLRQSIFYGHLGAWYGLGSYASFTHFNHAGETIEWRHPVAGGPPAAAIHRWFVSDGNETGEENLQVLVISRVGQPGIGEACVAGYVDALANADANVLARQVADLVAPDFACRVTAPQWRGAKGANAPTPFFGFTADGDPGVEDP